MEVVFFFFLLACLFLTFDVVFVSGVQHWKVFIGRKDKRKLIKRVDYFRQGHFPLVEGRGFYQAVYLEFPGH